MQIRRVVVVRSRYSSDLQILMILTTLTFSIFTTSASLVTSNFRGLPMLQKCEVNEFLHEQKEITIPGHLTPNGGDLRFRLVEKCMTRLPHCLKPCRSPIMHVSVSLNRSENDVADYYYNEDEDQAAVTVQFTEKGYFLYGSEYFAPDDVCVNGVRDDGVLGVSICTSKCSVSTVYGLVTGTNSNTTEDLESFDEPNFEVCIPKCCSLHKVLDLESDSCRDSGRNLPWVPLVYRSASRQICGEKRVNLKLHYSQVPPGCQHFNKYLIKSIPGTTRVRFRLLTNGSVLLREVSGARWTFLEPGTYCLDGIMNYGQGSSSEVFSGDSTDQVLLVCHRESQQLNGTEEKSGLKLVDPGHQSQWNLTGIVYSILLFCGVPFLLATVVMFVLVWNRQNVHGWTQFSHALAMLLHYLALGFANVISRTGRKDPTTSGSHFCKVIAITNHFSVLASFCWLTIINYNLFSMFRSLKTTVGRSKGVKRFVVYSFIAWGIPFVVVLVSVILDTFYGLHGDDGDCEVDLVVPLYGYRACYMVEEAHPFYLYYPVGVLMAVNLILCGMTFRNMWNHEESAKFAHEENKSKHRKKFSVMAKLFVVMGLVLLFEMSVWAFKEEGVLLPWYLAFPDFLNFLQAVAIFVLFACQPKILKQLAETYPCLTSLTRVMGKLSCISRGSGGGGCDGCTTTAGGKKKRGSGGDAGVQTLTTTSGDANNSPQQNKSNSESAMA